MADIWFLSNRSIYFNNFYKLPPGFILWNNRYICCGKSIPTFKPQPIPMIYGDSSITLPSMPFFRFPRPTLLLLFKCVPVLLLRAS